MTEKLVNLSIVLLGIGVLIIIHEFGHFWVALKLKFTVKEFSLGFGPKLFNWFGKSGINYGVRLFFLLGGFVRIEEIEQDLNNPPENNLGRSPKELWRRIKVISAGPLTNFAFAVILFFIYSLWAVGIKGTTEISTVAKDSPAEKVGLKSGDVIVSIGNIKKADLESILKHIQKSPKKPVHLKVRRGKELLTLTVVPKSVKEKLLTYRPASDATGWQAFSQRLFGRWETRQKGVIGVVFKSKPDPTMTISERLFLSVPETLNQTLLTMQLLIAPFAQPVLLGDVGGPIRIVYEFVSDHWYSFMDQMRFFGLLSFAIAFFNLLPLPLLDGGRILFLLVELILRRRNYNLELKITYVGLAFIIALVCLITFKDLHFVLLGRGQ